MKKLLALLATLVSSQCLFGAPTIIYPPQSRVLRVGDHMAFAISATGTAPLTYQWSKNGGNITGATNTSLALTNLQTTDSGTYTITVNDASLQPTTATATLSVTTGLNHLYPTNLVILHSGDGVAGLAATGNTAYLDQFTTDGTYVSSVMIPDSGSSSLLMGTTLTEVYMGSSSNNRVLMFGGYNTSKPGPTLSTSTATIVPRGIGTVNALGYYSLAVSDKNTALNSQKIGGIASIDGSAFWFTDGGTTASTIYNTNGTDTTILTTPGGRTSASIYNNDLYLLLSGGLYHFGNVPTGGGAQQQVFLTSNPNDFAISPDGLTIYVTDGSNLATGNGGIQRWDSDGANGFSRSYIFNAVPGAASGNNGPDGLVVDFSNFTGGGATGVGAIVYATTGTATTNSLVKVVDNGSSSTPTILFTFGPNQIGRGLRFAPVADAPTIVTQPTGKTPIAGQNAIFTVVAGGSAPFTYQWNKDGVALTNGGNISGALSAKLTVSSTSASDVGNYTVIVANDIGNVTSDAASLTLAPADPAIAFQPKNTTVAYGSNGVFTVTASGTSPFTYVWQKNNSPLSDGGNISGSTTSSLTVSSATCTDDGSYSVVVSNVNGTTNSANAVLTVNDPFIATQPTQQYALDGNTAVFTVVAGGTGSFSYQWQRAGTPLSDGGNIAGSTTASLTVSSVSSADATNYNVIVTGGCGTTVTSKTVKLVESTPVTIDFPPQDRTIHAGDNTSFVVLAGGTSPYQYQWSFNGSPLTDATNSYVLVPQAQAGNAGTYSVIVSNLAGSSASASALLNVSPAPIKLYPTNLVVLRAGNGAGGLVNSGNSYFLDQFTTNGQYLNTIAIPDSGPSALIGFNLAVDHYLTISSNGEALMIGGFNTSKPYTNAALNTTTAAAVPRGLGVVKADGSYSLVLADTNAIYDGSYIKTAASIDGISDFWTIDGAGVVYTTAGSPDVVITNSPAGRSMIQIYSNDVWACQTGGIFHYNGLATTSTPATKLFSAGSPNDFAVSPDGLTVYVTDGANVSTGGGGIQRWDNFSGTWSLTYTMPTPFTGTGNNGPDGIVVDWSNFTGNNGFGAVIYSTSGSATQNVLFQIVDQDGTQTATTLYTFGPNQVGRGLRFGPVASTVVAPPQLTVTRSGNTVTITWPDSATGYTLESTPSLPATWTATGLPVTDSNGQNTVTDTISTTQKYYRLHK